MGPDLNVQWSCTSVQQGAVVARGVRTGTPGVRARLALLAAIVVAGCAVGRPVPAPARPVEGTATGPLLFTERLTTPPSLPDTVSGEPRLVVLLPGYGATTGYFRGRIAVSSPRHSPLAVDLLGFGRSPRPVGRYTVDAHLGALRRTLADRGRVVLVGHSFGARLAVSYAARYPDDVDALVLLALPYYPESGGRDRPREYFRRRGRLAGTLWTSRRATRVTCVLAHGPLRWLAPHYAHSLPRDVRTAGLAHTVGSATSTLHDALYGHDLSADVARLRPGLPVTLVHGAEDRTAPPDGARAVARLHGRATLRVLGGVDHHPLLRRPAAVNAIVDSAVAAAPWD